MEVTVRLSADDIVKSVFIDDVEVSAQHTTHGGMNNAKDYTLMVPRTDGYKHTVAFNTDDVYCVAKGMMARIFVDGTEVGVTDPSDNKWRSLTGVGENPPTEWYRRTHDDSPSAADNWESIMACDRWFWGNGAAGMATAQAVWAFWTPQLSSGFPWGGNCGVYCNQLPEFKDAYFRFNFVVGEAPKKCDKAEVSKQATKVWQAVRCECHTPCAYADYNDCINETCPYEWIKGAPKGRCVWKQFAGEKVARCGCPNNNCDTRTAQCECNKSTCDGTYDTTSGSDVGLCKWDASKPFGSQCNCIEDIGIDRTARISMWPGKVNQHNDNGVWMTDPDGVSGGWPSTTFPSDYGDRKLEYCQKFWPNSTGIQLRAPEQITFYTAGNSQPYTTTRDVWECVGA
jgi:hypothetical protein